ncbi:ABC transporter ATP-binding protein [uncultured Sphaerochaeta sp.]|uniref:ABC transporter ATP-binding protein n=1 Tax=uncultured Sphaerochaeta sp. TaxID=886478 RepID=UPI002A0A6C15|nr:ABC transporter ATP-binding protein [uncultured Sphaerochaeta sp.]
MNKILEVKDLRTYFFTNTGTVKAVNGVSFFVCKGETFGIVGESGCGKSQTCRAILSLIKKPGKIVGGEILYKGQDIIKMSQDELRRIRGKEMSIIFQEPMTSLNPVLTIKKQMFEAFSQTNMTKQEKLQRSIELLRLVGIPSPENRINEYVHQFSGGMRQRAMIAVALCSQPELLIADEPTTALDVTIQDQIIKLLAKLKQELNMSIILVTHDLGVVAQMCDRVAVMYAGIIVELTDTTTLFSKPRHPYSYALMGSLPDQSKIGSDLEVISGSPPNLVDMPSGCPFAPRCKYAIDICLKKLPELVAIEKGHLTRCHRLEIVSKFPGIIADTTTKKSRGDIDA